ncbi:MAG: hypothetical protein QOC77_2956 [Thermoleophilaceae bacterium]|nr:hypothetical protein [Thermoleophilaceae bacterium]MEA2469861.1 hypothetical protein [Thermoleophilaceae bacterium]
MVALGIAAVLGAAWMIIAPRTADLAAQIYRVGLFKREGFALWDNAWFGGHHIPGYSVLFPPLGSLIGARALGLIAVATSAVLFADLMRRHYKGPLHWAVAWFAVVAVGDLFIGRLTFALGVTAALACLAAVSHRRYWLAMPLAIATPAASPVAGIFLGFVLVVIWTRLRPRARVYLLALVTAGVAAMAFVFPDGGQQPYDFAAALVAFVIVIAVYVQLAPSEVVLRRATALYAAAVAAAYILPTPMGSNVARLSVLVAGPLFITSRRRSPRVLVVLTCVAIGLWQAWAPVTETGKAAVTDANQQTYFKPLLAELERVGAHAGRVEVVPTATRWESVYVARDFAMARGWETQLDRAYNGLFYKDEIPPATYHRWLQAEGVRFVAVSDAPTERWGTVESRLIASRPSYLRPVWRSAHWQLFAVRGARGLAGPGQTVVLRPEGFVLTMPRPGVATVRVRWTNYWTVVPHGCVRRARDGFTRVFAPTAGTYVVQAHWSLGATFADDGSCKPASLRPSP